MWKPIAYFVVPFLLAHYGWYQLQQKYVPPEKQHKHPFVDIYEKYIRKNDK